MSISPIKANIIDENATPIFECIQDTCAIPIVDCKQELRCIPFYMCLESCGNKTNSAHCYSECISKRDANDAFSQHLLGCAGSCFTKDAELWGTNYYHLCALEHCKGHMIVCPYKKPLCRGVILCSIQCSNGDNSCIEECFEPGLDDENIQDLWGCTQECLVH